MAAIYNIYNSYRSWCQDQDNKIGYRINLRVPQSTIEGTLNSAIVSLTMNTIYYRGNLFSSLQGALLAASGKIAQSATLMLLNSYNVPAREFIAYGIGTSIAPLAGKVLPTPVACKETLTLSVMSFLAYALFNRLNLPQFPLIVMMRRI